MKEEIKQIIAEILEISVNDLNDESSSQNTNNWDSLNHMNIIFAIEEKLDVAFDDEEIMHLTSIAKILNSIESKK
jgi:acyl carrier protein